MDFIRHVTIKTNTVNKFRRHTAQSKPHRTILPLLSQYIYSLLLFVVNNRDYFVSNSVQH
jgi:hypothetical protein